MNLKLAVVGFFAALAIPLFASAQTTEPAPSPAASPSSAPTLIDGRRALAAPLDTVFPSTDFTGPTIGVPTDHGIRTYGWLDFGTEMSTSKYSTYPMSYQVIPNRVELDQAIFRIDREPDTVQTDHVDWGFRLSNLYGTDYRFTTGEGWWSGQLLHFNRAYGYDLPEAFGVLYIPKVAQGMTLTVGRYISPPDIEAQLSLQNFLYSHSIMFTFDAYTQTGILSTIKLSNYWTVLAGLHSGNDIAPWAGGTQHFPTGEVFGRWVSHSNKDSVMFGIDAINSSAKFKGFTIGCPNNTIVSGSSQCLYGHDNLQQFNATYTHAFSSKLQNLFEAYYIYQFNAPVGGTINNGPVRYGAGGGTTGILLGRSTSVGLVDYVEWAFSPRDFLSFRLDYMNDPRGQRTGALLPTFYLGPPVGNAAGTRFVENAVGSAYGSITAGVTHHFNSTLEIRPELRTEKAFNSAVLVYDNYTKSYQSSIGIDLIQQFGNP